MRNMIFAVIAASALVIAQAEQALAGEYLINLGGGLAVSPDYEGSDDYKVRAMPFIKLGWKADPVTPKGGTGLQLGLHDISLKMPGVLDAGIAKLYRPEGQYRFNLGLAYKRGRDEDRNQALDGMTDIDAHVLAKIGVSFKTKGPGWRYSLNFSQDLTGETDASTIDGEIGYLFPLSKKLFVTPFTTISWADQDYMQSYFGVSEAQASTSSNAQYDADSGIKSVGLGIKLGWKITDNLKMNNTFRYVRLTSDAADSPLVEDEGSANQFKIKAALVYAF